MTLRIVIAEDSVLFREGLVRLLTEADHDVIGLSVMPSHWSMSLRSACRIW